jgi:signal transduction histidine kinase
MTGMPRARITIRTRLALVYGGLFLASGIVLLTVTYGLVAQQLPESPGKRLINVLPGSVPDPRPTATTTSTATATPAVTPPVRPAATPTVVDVFGGSIQGAIQTRHKALVAVLTQGGIALALVGSTAVVFGWLIAGRLLQPLHRMTETARRIARAPAAHSGLHERIALDGPEDEIKELADTFDAMIERLDTSFDGQRRFVANASHELRTPLTINRALLEVAVHRKSASPEIIQLGETLLEINARHERLIDGLLLLTRSEPAIVERSFVDLADIVEHVVSQLPEGGGVKLQVQADEAPTAGDPVLLERVVQNLVQNGLRHNLTEGGWVAISTGIRDEAAELVVSNTGPVIPRYEVPNLFEPFHRFGADRIAGGSPGAGLGLSIVQAVARAHGGDVQAEPREGGGLVVTVRLTRSVE